MSGYVVLMSLLGLLFALAPFVLLFVLHRWGQRVAAPRPGLGWRLLAWVPRLSGLALVAGIATTAVRMIRAFEQVAAVDPSQKGETLGAATAAAMGTTFAGLGVAVIGCLVSAIGFAAAGSLPGPQDSGGKREG
jgi:peptidoglycan biosynthesis protein MviN/MurJ (putative lipid II flippase)